MKVKQTEYFSVELCALSVAVVRIQHWLEPIA